MSTAQREKWLEAMFLAEGHGRLVYQCSGPVMEAVKLAFYLDGKRPSQSLLTGKGQWSECFALAGCQPTISRNSRTIDSLGEQDVWCVTTDLGTWTAEQDGFIFLTGNSNANGTESWVNNPHRKGEDDLGPIYSAQWRRYEHIEMVDSVSANDTVVLRALLKDGYEIVGKIATGADTYRMFLRKEIDQLQNLIYGIKADPYGRRHIVNSWNVGKLDKVALPACHAMFQCYVRTESGHRYLDLKMYQRSADTFLGVPFNIASYAMLAHLLATLTDLEPGRLTISFGDLHIYQNHLPQVFEQLARDPMMLPELTVRRVNSLDEVVCGVFQLHGYQSHPALKGKMAK